MVAIGSFKGKVERTDIGAKHLGCFAAIGGQDRVSRVPDFFDLMAKT